MSPIQRIAEEIEPHSQFTASQLEGFYVSIMHFLKDRARVEIEVDQESDAAKTAAAEFLAFTEMMTIFGESLLAYDEVEGVQPAGGSEGMSN